jgi:hypothetical protein
MTGRQDAKDWPGRKSRKIRAAAVAIAALAVIFSAFRGLPGLRAVSGSQATPAARPFATLVEQLSEPNGAFDTDNLISNETSYLHVAPALDQAGAGGVYIGVGPDQNFSYIARLRPTDAFIVDIRRDNLLMHLLLKALFATSRNRAEFVSLLTGRPAPDRVETWRDASIEKIVAYIDETKAAATSARSEDVERLHAAIRRSGVPVSAKDFQTIDRFHSSFVDEGLSLQFHSTGRAAREYYPTYRDLLLETDRQGRKRCYLASEDDFQFVKALEARDGVVPVVGDLAGPHAVAAIGQLMTERGQRLSAFYVSNVENYLFQNGSYARYVENLKRLPHSDRSLIIRAIFGGYSLPESAPGYYSTSTVQTLNELLAACAAGKCRSYYDLLRR